MWIEVRPHGQSMVEILLTSMTASDWDAVSCIYLEGIATGHATFETVAPTWEKWDASHRPDCRLVARAGDAVLGWAALGPVSGRCVYGGVAEVSLYVGADHRGKGIGRTLLDGLIRLSEQRGIWTLQTGIFPENRASLALHHKCGFREVGRREKIGQMHGVWRDVILLERRSQRIGRSSEPTVVSM